MSLRQTGELTGNLPCLIRRVNAADSDDIEVVLSTDDPDQKNQKNARNLLRHLLRGASLYDKNKNSIITADILKTLLDKKNPALLRAARQEMQYIFTNGLALLRNAEVNETTKEMYEIFQSTVLSILPFFDPEPGETLKLPQKINNEWCEVNYTFSKIDISPQSGPLAAVITEDHRIYAYGLTPDDLAAHTHLLLMGTTYPGGQGYELANLYNVYPGDSVGLHHDMTRVIEWLEEQQDGNVVIAGHSKGGTMGLAFLTRVPASSRRKICQINSFNPTALADNSLIKLNSIWATIVPDQRPEINIYTQVGDPVFYLEKGFLPDMHLYRIYPNETVPLNISFIPNFIANAYVSHVHHFSGSAKGVRIVKESIEKENALKRRQLFNDIKHVVTYCVYPFLYVSTWGQFFIKKIEKNLPPVVASPWRVCMRVASIVPTIVMGLMTFTAACVGAISGAIYSGIKIGAQLCLESINKKPVNVDLVESAADKEIKNKIIDDLGRKDCRDLPNLRRINLFCKKDQKENPDTWEIISKECHKKVMMADKLPAKKETKICRRAIAQFSQNIKLFSVVDLQTLIIAQEKREAIQRYEKEIKRLKGGLFTSEAAAKKIAVYNFIINQMKQKEYDKQHPEDILRQIQDDLLIFTTDKEKQTLIAKITHELAWDDIGKKQDTVLSVLGNSPQFTPK